MATSSINAGQSSYLTDLSNNLPVGTSSSFQQIGTPSNPIAAPTPSPTNYPVIKADAISNTNPIKIPDPANNGAQPASDAISKSQAAVNSFATDTQNQADTAAQRLQQSQKTGEALIGAYLGKGDAQLQAEADAGIPNMRKYATQQSNLYNTSQINLNDQLNTILQNPSLTAGQRQAAIQATTQQNAYNIANIGIAANMAQANYQAAQELVNHQIDVKYAPLKDAADYYNQLSTQNASLFTTAQNNAMTAKAAALTQQYNEAVYNDHLQKDTQVQMIKDAAAQGATPDVLQQMTEAMNSGKTIGEVAQLAGGFLKASQYTPLQTGIDDNGMPIYSSYNQKTGKLEVLNPNNTLGATGSNDTVVNGYQFGASTTIGAYASNTAQQVSNIKNTVTKIQSIVGNVTDASTAQAAISAVAPKSPVTGDMVMQAAQQYGVDPATIIGVMQAETQCGTDGSKGATQCNWGNVGNTDQLMASGKSVKMTPQQGVDAIAQQLAKRKVQDGQIDPAQPPENGTLTPQQVAIQTINNAPRLLRPAMGYALSSGATYIDSSKIPDVSNGGINMKTMAQAYASSHNVPVLNADQVSVIKGADEAIRNITDVIAPAWAQIAPEDNVDKLKNDATKNVSALLDTNFYALNKTFAANKENLAQQIRALSQSAPKGSLLSTAEAALPDNSGYGLIGLINPYAKYDTLKDGNMKLQRTLDLLNQTVRTFVPTAQPVTLPDTSTKQPSAGATGTLNGTQWVLGKDGLMYPANNNPQ